MDGNCYGVICYFYISCQSNGNHGIISFCRGCGVFSLWESFPMSVWYCSITSTVIMVLSMDTLSNRSTEVYLLSFPVDFPQPDLFVCLCIFSMTEILPESQRILCRIHKRSFSTSTVVIFFHLHDCDLFPPL